MDNGTGSAPSAEFAVGVLSPPEAPSSLRVTRIHSDGATLAWNAPDVDGGAPVTGYIVERRDAFRGGWSMAGGVDAHTHSFKVWVVLDVF